MCEWMLYLALLFVAMAVCAADSGEGLPEQFRRPFTESYAIRKGRHDAMQDYFASLQAESAEGMAAAFTQDFSSVEAYQRSLEPCPLS